MKREGLIMIISAPSGAGKTTLCRELRRRFPEMKESISYTTRAPRPSEVNGEDYHFVSRAKFHDMVTQEAFAEWAEVHGNFYGTALATLVDARATGVDLLLDIDCQGALTLKERFEGGVYVFILPPSLKELRRRLEGRSSDAPDVIERRIKRASEEIREARWYDYIVINDNLENATSDLCAIVLAQFRKSFRMLGQVAKLFEI